MNFATRTILSNGGTGNIPDFIPVHLVLGQSNNEGNAENDRLELLTYPQQPSGVYIYWKPDYTASDNGNWEPAFGAVNTRGPNFTPGERLFGHYLLLGSKMHTLLRRNIYVLMCAESSTSLYQRVGEDWDPTSVNECFEKFMENYFDVAIAKLQTEFPGVPIKVFISWHQGETDAVAGEAAGYAARFDTLFSAVRAHNTLLNDAIWTLFLLNHDQSAGETTINNALIAKAAANPSFVFTVDVSDMPRKVDLTVDQKGGFTPTKADDNHISYLGHEAKSDREYAIIKSHFGWTAPDSEFLENTQFPDDPSTFMRLQMSRNKLTIGTNNIVTNIDSDFGIDFTPANDLRFKVDRRKGNIFFSSRKTDGRAVGVSAVGSTWFNQSFSWGCWVKPHDGIPAATYFIFHDVRNTGSANLSRFFVQINTSGQIQVGYAVGSLVSAITSDVIFTNFSSIHAKYIAVTVQSGGSIKIYVGDPITGLAVEKALTASSSIAALTMANYVNATNPPTIGASLTGAGTWGFNFFGMLREMRGEHKVWTIDDIQDRMRN